MPLLGSVYGNIAKANNDGLRGGQQLAHRTYYLIIGCDQLMKRRKRWIAMEAGKVARCRVRSCVPGQR
jgi:hypothetical protein